MYSQDDFDIQVDAREARCPQGHLVPLRLNSDDSLTARFGPHCAGCPQKSRCTSSKKGRILSVHMKHELLTRHRQRQAQPDWRTGYNQYRPRVERKIAQLMRYRHGGRRARVRGRYKIARDFAMLAGASNLSRMAKLLAVSPAPLT